MIIIEDKLKQLFETLPEIETGGGKHCIYFDFGDEKDLNTFLKQKEKKYPLVWLETGYEETHNEYDVDVDLNIIIATYALSSTYSNQQRLDVTFKTVLIPLLNNVITAFSQANNVSIKNDVYDIKKYYNYGEGFMHKTTDIWDAIQLKISLNITEDCFKEIYY